jgi:hypothetical protein
MRKCVIERTVPGAEERVLGHARRGGFRADSVRRVEAPIDPTTAELIR